MKTKRLKIGISISTLVLAGLLVAGIMTPARLFHPAEGGVIPPSGIVADTTQPDNYADLELAFLGEDPGPGSLDRNQLRLAERQAENQDLIQYMAMERKYGDSAYPGSAIDFTDEPYHLFENYGWGDLVDAPVNAANPSYERQRVADSLEERQELQQIYAEMVQHTNLEVQRRREDSRE